MDSYIGGMSCAAAGEKPLQKALFSPQKINMGLADKLLRLKNEKAAANLKAGQEYLEKNKQRAGVVALPSGLQYEIITEGAGPKPQATSTVTCHYHGTLIDGTVFDSSVKRGQPASFPLNMVIKGWTEGLQLMSVGSKYRFFIPPRWDMATARWDIISGRTAR
jgi:FKBP-type peptidyl-prolyl cis-trans isomerases 1